MQLRASELRGARKHVILDGVDHHETAFHKLAFGEQYQFITGKAAGDPVHRPGTEAETLNGRVTGMADGLYTNLPVADAEVKVYEVDARTGERKTTQPAHRKTTGTDGKPGQ